ncbi:14053_t:CDS:1, partial [Racocetra persica]
LGVRFNIALDITYKVLSFAVRTEVPEKPDITYTLKCKNTDEFDVKRKWNAFSISTLLNKFNDSKTYFDNICSPPSINNQPISSNLKVQEITKTFNGANRMLKIQEITKTFICANRILDKQDQSEAVIRIVDKFIGFFKQQDLGIVKIITEKPTELSDALFVSVIQGFTELANTGVKK